MVKLDKKTNLVLGFLRMAYKDYIAARVLLNRGYTLQGVIIASTAIEKYFKATLTLFSDKPANVHMDRFELIKKAIEDIGFGVLIEKIDPLFIEILGKAYRLRYYDNVTEPITIGFFKNQFIGELDGTIELFERLFTITNGDANEQILTPLKQDYNVSQNPDLSENNWVTTKEKNKKLFMETNCIGFAVYVHPDNVFEEIEVSSIAMNIPYNGSMMLIKLKDDGKGKNVIE